MCGQVLVSLLVPGVLWNEMKIFSTNDECSVHFCGDNGASEDLPTDGDKSSERALLVCSSKSAIFMRTPNPTHRRAHTELMLRCLMQ